MTRLILFRLGSCGLVLAGCSGSAADGVIPQAEPHPDSGVVSAAGCPQGFDSFEPGDTQVGGLHKLNAVLLEANPAAAAKFQNQWTIELRFVDGTLTRDFRVTSLQTFMPVHGHPGQPEPSVTGGREGQFDLELHFTMRGPWEVRLAVASESAGMDQFVFDVCVRE